MNPEEKKDNSAEFGKVIDVLHNKQKLPSLRTYQGDMAEFIKEKNQSTISIALKEKERKEEREQEQNLAPVTKKTVATGSGFQMNLVSLFLSIILLAGGAVAVMYVMDFFKKEPVAEVVIETKIIPYNNSITLTNLTNKNIGTELAKISPTNGVNILKISDIGGNMIIKAKDFFNFLEISLPSTLGRTLKDDYAMGIFSQNNLKPYFLVISVNDFGQAFSGMLAWEETIVKDLAFLEDDSPIDSVSENLPLATATKILASTTIATSTNKTISTSTASTTVVIKIPMKPEIFSWKDIIVKNKDTRALVNAKNQSKIAYTFLDKNTILITNNLSAIGDLSFIYASRAVAR